MEKILPFKYPSLIDAYSGDSGRVAVQLINENQIPLVIVNHLTVCYYPDSKTCGFNWDYYNEEGFKQIDIKDDLMNTEDTKEYLISCINSGYYVYLFLDHYYIESSDVYQIYHKVHDSATIFGYNSTSEIFYVADNFKEGKYLIAEVPFLQIEEARKASIDKPALKFLLNNSGNYNFDIDKIILILKGYLEGKYYLLNKDKVSPCKEVITYGIDIYNIIKNYLQDLVEGKVELDLRAFQVMVNHKAVILLLVEYMGKKGLIKNATYIASLFEEVRERFMVCRNITIKFNLTRDTNLINAIISKLDDIVEKEKYAVNYLLNTLALR